MKNIPVTGATGILGTTVIQTLLQQRAPDTINVLTRSEEKRIRMQEH